MTKKKILITFGTRPELIKLLSIILELKKLKKYNIYICNTAQHVELLNPLINFHKLKVNFNLNILKPKQSLSVTTSKILDRFEKVVKKLNPDCIIVQGDTSTAFTCSLVAFYNKIRVYHIEAGLRTHNIFSPWPEELNRKFISEIADYNFAPTIIAKKNLISEGIKKSKILCTGNTVIDLLFITLNKINNTKKIKEKFEKKFKYLDDNSFKILVSIHRRESFGEGLKNIFLAMNHIAINKKIKIIYSAHPNPDVIQSENKYLKKKQNIKRIGNLNYMDFIYLMSKSDLILSDSGGIQEEAPSLGKPNLVLRDFTERPETIIKKTSVLVGTNKEKILREFNKIYYSKKLYSYMSKKRNLYGDGKAYLKIIRKLEKIL